MPNIYENINNKVNSTLGSIYGKPATPNQSIIPQQNQSMIPPVTVYQPNGQLIPGLTAGNMAAPSTVINKPAAPTPTMPTPTTPTIPTVPASNPTEQLKSYQVNGGIYNPNTNTITPNAGGLISNTGHSANFANYNPGYNIDRTGQNAPGVYTTPDGLTLPTGAPTGSPLDAFQEQWAAEQLALQQATPKTQQELYNEKLGLYQDQINQINSIYSDLIGKAQAKGAIRTTDLLGQNRASQARGGLIGSDFGQAQTFKTQEAANEITASEVGQLANERAMKISELMGMARQDASAELAAKTLAKQQGAEALIKYFGTAKEQNKSKLSNNIKSYLANKGGVENITPAMIKELATNYKLSDDEVKGIISDTQAGMSAAQIAAETAKAKLEGEKADTQKTLSDISNWGKMTEYQKAQIAIDNYKAKNPSGTATDKKASGLATIASELSQTTKLQDGTPVLDTNNKITPAGYSYLVQNAPQLGLEKKDILEQFGQFLYKDKKNGYSAYGLTGNDEKILTGIIPE